MILRAIHLTIILAVALAVPIIHDVRAEELQTAKGCIISKEYQNLQWEKLRQAARLGAGDAILTCDNSKIVIRSGVAFRSFFQWKRTTNGFLGTVKGYSFHVIPRGSQTVVEIMKVDGEAFYVLDSKELRATQLTIDRHLTPGELENLQHASQVWQKDLELIGWKPLVAGLQLRPWDMVQTREDGQVEIEIIEWGPIRIFDAETDVLDHEGRPTGIKKIPSNSLITLDPQLYRAAKVNKVDGAVWISTNRKLAQELYERRSRDPTPWLRKRLGSEKAR